MSGRIDHLYGFSAQIGPDRHDLPVPDRHVGAEPWGARAIDDSAPGHQEVEHG